MSRQKYVAGTGLVPLTDEEEVSRDAEEEKWETGCESRIRNKAIKKSIQELEVNGIEKLMDAMTSRRRATLDSDMVKTYNKIKKLRGQSTIGTKIKNILNKKIF